MKIKCLLILLLMLPGFSRESRLIERWHTYEEIRDQLQLWDEQFGNNPNPSPGYSGSGIIYHLEEIGRSTQADLPFWAVRLSYNADVKEDEPRILILGQCHAEEIFGVETAMRIIHMFLNPQEYIGNMYLSYMQTLLQKAEIWVVPTYNPEGLQVVHGFYDDDSVWIQDESYRKNRRDLNNNDQFDFTVGVGNDSDGVDLNRNYDFNWFLGDDAWEIDGGCSSNPNYFANFDYYRGPQPFSETETQAIRDFALENKFLLSIAYHSSRSGCVSEKVISSWEWDGGKQSPDFPVISALGEDIANFIPDEDGSGYYLFVPGSSRRGNAHDWFYTRTGCIQYLIEMGTQNLQPDDPDLIEDTIDRNLRGAFHLMNRAVGSGFNELGADYLQVTGIITDAGTGLPVTAEVKILEMDGPMLAPRTTDEFGRYRRLLYPGTFTMEFRSKGYVTQTVQITSSTSAITERDVALVPKAWYDLSFDVSVPALYTGQPFVLITDEFGTDTLFISDTDPVVMLPENQYDILVTGTDDLFPLVYHIEMTENTHLEADLKWAGVIVSEEFNHLENWNVESGYWTAEMGTLKSQSGLTYSEGMYLLSYAIPAVISDSMNLVVKTDLKYEMEWENDTAFVGIRVNDHENAVYWSDQNWTMHTEYHPMGQFPAGDLQLWVGVTADSTLGYRGLEMDRIAIMFEPEGDCPGGDINRDGTLDVSDIVTMIDAIMDGVWQPYQTCAADMTGDGNTDILDIVYLLMIILGL